MQFRSIFRILLCMGLCLLLLLCPFPALAQEKEALSRPTLDDAETVYLLHLSGEAVICEKNADTVIEAGAMAKLMAGYLACRELEAERSQSILQPCESYLHCIRPVL